MQGGQLRPQTFFDGRYEEGTEIAFWAPVRDWSFIKRRPVTWGRHIRALLMLGSPGWAHPCWPLVSPPRYPT